MGEKFAANPVTGTGSLSVPIYVSPGRSGFGPQLSLSYDSSAGNGPFGFGWNLSLPSITRKTDKGLPKYQDAEESDVFILSGAEDLVPAFKPNTNQIDEFDRDGYKVRRYRPRIEGLFARIERWTDVNTGETHWRSISRDNITTLYGKTAESRIADPADPTRVFSWLICESHDDKGNAVVYEYKEENSDGVVLSQVHEKNRTPVGRSANRYLKRIQYGNRVSRLVQPDLSQADWMFEAVFDYGEHGPDNPKPDDSVDWLCRHDPFSSYRAGFEVRTYRVCQRVLMFHHFPDELGTADYLVRSTEFIYSQSPIASFIQQATQSGYVRQPDGTYLKKSLPPLSFEYTQAIVSEEIQVVDPESLENLPAGADGLHYQWLDLDGEGLQGVLSEQEDAWYYKRNLSPISVVKENGKEKVVARFEPLVQVSAHPSMAEGMSARHQFLDLAGDGQLDVVQFETPVSGFYERTQDERWNSFVPFESVPNLAWSDPNLKFLDLTGDGHADILITENDALTWYPSLAEEGFGTAIGIPKPRDEEEGPAVVFADGTQAIFVADISGDGLTDIVRIRNGEVCYWPNLGYGRFGAKVTMDNAPWFDAPDQFDQRRIRLADIDGSGTTDIIYLGSHQIDVYRNHAGNRWSKAESLTSFPAVDNLSSVTAVDLLGNGTACLVWTSPLPGDASQPMRYIDLMGGQKPHLLVKTVNNLGAETHVQYTPSTKFYLADKAAGKPWITRLPFPVHVVERVETYDRISRNRFVTRYAYHHGHFDGIEREFRGFGMVEQYDTEEFAALNASGEFPSATNIDEASHVPPVLTKTWFHTGAYLGGSHISNFFAGLLDEKDTGEYYREPGLNDEQAKKLLLDDTVLPAGLTVEEEREACRSLKGSMLRQEVYALDGTLKEEHPYVVTEQNFTIRQLQPIAGNRHGVFFTHAREAINYHYERNPADPRLSHALTLEVDKFGNVRKSLAIGYGRRQADPQLAVPDQKKQTTTLITSTENEVTNPIDNDPDNYRTPLPSETRTYELTGFKPANNADRFSFDEWVDNDFALLASVTEIAYEQIADPNQKQKRLIEHVRTLYRKNDLTGLLSLGQVESHALPGESYKLAFTPGLLSSTYKRGAENLLPDPAGVLSSKGADGGAYTRSNDHKAKNLFPSTDPADHWWIPSGQVFYDMKANIMNPALTATQELQEAREHFFLPRRLADPFGQSATVDYEHDLLVISTKDPVDNTVQAENDYRVLQPKRVTDPNGNRAAAAFDALGMIAGTAVMGKENESDPEKIGDTLDDPTTRMEYNLFNWKDNKKPNFVHTFAREKHGDPNTRWQESYSYSDGFGREIQKKIQAEPGLVDGVHVDKRWVGTGWTIFNNKGKPVRQYEPFFDDTHDFKFGKQIGVSPVMFYDPVERVVATLHPNHTWGKVVFDPWRQETWDINDTVLKADPKSDPDVGDYLTRLPSSDCLPTWHESRKNGQQGDAEKDAATKAAAHANTPTVAHLDTLGRTFLTIADNATAGKYATRAELDIEGNQRAVVDAKDRIVMRYDYDMLANRIHQASMEAGARWMLNDVAGKPIRAWDSRGHEFRTVYDPLRRPTDSFLREGAGTAVLVGRTVYGETRPNPETINLRGKVAQLFDQAGIVTSVAYDFKGNLLESRRDLLPTYKLAVDWLQNPAATDGSFTSRTTYDALNRPLTATAPDGSVYRPTFNEANLLDKVDVNLRGAAEATPFVTNIDYDAKGQRQRIDYGNGASTFYDYDPLTLRLTHLLTRRNAAAFPDDCPQPPPAGWLGCQMQNLHYTYDPVGNITHIRDDAQQTIYFRNRRVEPSAEYTYDAIYRLIEATGREHLGQAGGAALPPEPLSYNDKPRTGLRHPGDGNAMGRYIQQYFYDEVGNFKEMIHSGTDPLNPGWTRAYAYDEPSLLEAAKKSNPVTSTTIRATTETYSTAGDGYDPHGNMLRMPQLQIMQWDFKDRLLMTQRQKVNNKDEDGVLHHGERTYYVYDAGGQRVRKVTERAAGGVKDERIYLGGFEIYRQHSGVNAGLVRESLHIMDDKQRIALVETRTLDTAGNDPAPQQLIRYQFGNHLGSASLELDDQAQVISYEEYFPYGSTSYQAVHSQTETPKRYRYTGKERDRESGLYYHGARYYVPWLGRWASCDPIGIKDDINLFLFVKDNPLKLVDQNGTQETEGNLLVVGPWGSSNPTFRAPPAEVQGGLGRVTVDQMGTYPGIRSLFKTDLVAYQHAITQVVRGGGRYMENPIRAIYVDEVGVTATSHPFTFAEMETVGGFTQTGTHRVPVFRRIEGFNPDQPIYTLQPAGEPTESLLVSPSTPATRLGPPRVSWGARVLQGLNRFRRSTGETLVPRAVSTAKSFGGALTQTFKSMIPGIAEAEAYVSQFNGVAPALSFAAFALGESAKSAAAQGSAYLGQAYTALAAPVEVGAGGTAAVTGLAVVAAAGSVTLAGVTIHGAATGDVNESPVDVADKSLGTGFGDLYGWSQRSWVGFAVAYSSPIGWLAIGANKLAGY